MKFTKYAVRLTAVVLSIATLLAASACINLPINSSDSALSDSSMVDPGDIPVYSKRVYARPDEKAIAQMLNDMKECGKQVVTEDNKAALKSKREALYAALYKANTARTVAEIKYYQNGSDEYLSSEYSYIQKYITKLNDDILNAEKELFGSEYHDYLVSLTDENYAAFVLGYTPMTDEQLALSDRVTELQTQYGALDPETDVANITEIYIEMIKKRNALARTYKNGDGYYKNYPEYAYKELYGRDYDANDVENFCAAVLKYISPLKNAIVKQQTGTDAHLDESTLKIYARRVIELTAPDTVSSWDYMISHGLYDFKQSNLKIDTSFVTDFFEYGDGFMFISPSDSLCYDLPTVLHEFGHYNAIFAEDYEKSQGLYVDNYDLFETHSQAFVLLSLPAIKRVVGDNYYKRIAYNLFYADIAWTALSNCLFDEFERTVYAADENTLTADYLQSTFVSIRNKYWQGSDFQYYVIPHLFFSPSYCISYSVSLMLASEIWATGGDAATEEYLDLVSYGGKCTLTYATEKCGLSYPLLPDTVYSAAQAYRAAFLENYGVSYALSK